MDGLAQAVGSGTGPGTLSPPVNGFFLPFTPCNRVSPKDASPVCFCRVSVGLDVWIRMCVCVYVWS